MNFEDPNARRALKEKSHAWEKRFKDALSELLAMEGADFDKLIDIIWEKGILDRVCPLDPEEKSARKEVGSEVWEGTREDPELYWRLLYSAAGYLEAAKRNWTMYGGGFAPAGISQGATAVIFSPKFNDYFDEEQRKNPIIVVIPAVIEKIKKEMSKLGITPPEKLIPFFGKGKYKGIPVKTDRYTSDGKICLKIGDDASDEQRREFFDLVFSPKVGGSVLPQELDPNDFVEEESH